MYTIFLFFLMDILAIVQSNGDMKSLASVLRSSTNHLANDIRRAASELAAQRALDCKVGNGNPRLCDAQAKALLQRLSKGDKQKESYASASMRRVRSAVTTCSEGDGEEMECMEAATSDIQHFGYDAHQMGSILIQNAKSAAALAHADAEAEGENEEERLRAAKEEFERFAPASLFDKEEVDIKTGEKSYPTRDSVLKLAAANKLGEATEIVSSDDEVVSVVSLHSKCNEEKNDELRRSISTVAGSGMTLSVASGPAGTEGRGCQYIYKTKVESGTAKTMSKKISDQVAKGLRRMRRLGASGESTDTVSSSPRAEEVKYGNNPETTKWDSPTYDSKDDSGDAGDGDGYGDDAGFGSLNSEGERLCAVTSACILAYAISLSLL